jgi:hypothetical protein
LLIAQANGLMIVRMPGGASSTAKARKSGKSGKNKHRNRNDNTTAMNNRALEAMVNNMGGESVPDTYLASKIEPKLIELRVKTVRWLLSGAVLHWE